MRLKLLLGVARCSSPRLTPHWAWAMQFQLFDNSAKVHLADNDMPRPPARPRTPFLISEKKVRHMKMQ